MTEVINWIFIFLGLYWAFCLFWGVASTTSMIWTPPGSYWKLPEASMRVGSHHPLHCTALGKVLLASAESAVLQEHHEAAVARGGLLQKTPATILDPDKFLEELRSVASVGYALDREEFETGLCCAAAPIQGSEGAVVAALSLSIPRARCSDDALLDRVVPAVTESARRLSRELGAVD